MPEPPRAKIEPREISAHGETWRDDYAWIRADNWRDVLADPAALPADIRAHLEAENAYAAEALAPASELQAELTRELSARLQEDDSDPPAPDGAWAYYARYRPGGQHRLYCRQPRDGGEETLLLDGDALAADKAFFRLGDARHSPDHRRLAWSADERGSEMYAIRVRDLETAADLDDLVDNTTGEMVWTHDSLGFLYILQDENHRPWRVQWHRLGAPLRADVCVYEEADRAWFLALHPTRLGRRAFILAHSHDAAETRVVDLDDPRSPRLVAPRRPGLRYFCMDHGEAFYIRANVGGAEDYQVLVAPAQAPEEANWRPLLPEKRGRILEGAALFEQFLAVLARENALPRLIIHELETGVSHEIAFDAEAYALALAGGYEFATTTLRFSFSSMACSEEIYDYDMRARTRTLVKKQMEPADFVAANYVVRRLAAPAPDGESIPVSLLTRRETPLDGSAPLVIYGYGAYGYAMDAGFSTNRLSLVDRGFVYALAHVRGGTDKGRRWYENGKLERKPNTFSDFIAATRHLVAERYADPRRIVAHGGSAGGMLMGVIANEAPELYAGIVADVPFVDVLDTMLDATLPLTPPEWLEWGDPRERTAFATIRGYSPYDNVRAAEYPAILALAGLADPRVTYWEPAKWIARLRALGSGGPFLLTTAMAGGHAGAPGRFDRLDEVAHIYAFAIAVVEGRL